MALSKKSTKINNSIISPSNESIMTPPPNHSWLSWFNNAVLCRISIFPHAVYCSENDSLCWCGNAIPNHHLTANKLDISSVMYRNVLFHNLINIWNTKPKIKSDAVIMVTALCEPTYTDLTTGHVHAIRRSVNIVLTEDNLSSATITIFNNLQNLLNTIEQNTEQNTNHQFNNLQSLILSASILKQKQFIQPKYIKNFTFNPKYESLLVAVQTRMHTKIGSKRKAASSTIEDDEDALFIPRNSEIAKGITTESHPYLNNLSIKRPSNEENVSSS